MNQGTYISSPTRNSSNEINFLSPTSTADSIYCNRLDAFGRLGHTSTCSDKLRDNWGDVDAKNGERHESSFPCYTHSKSPTDTSLERRPSPPGSSFLNRIVTPRSSNSASHFGFVSQNTEDDDSHSMASFSKPSGTSAASCTSVASSSSHSQSHNPRDTSQQRRPFKESQSRPKACAELALTNSWMQHSASSSITSCMDSLNASLSSLADMSPVRRCHSDRSGQGRLHASLSALADGASTRNSNRNRPSMERSHSSKSHQLLSYRERKSSLSEELIHVCNLEVLDPSGETGMYTGTFCPYSCAPCGSGKLVFFGNGGYYDGQWASGGIWSGVGRLCNRLGDVYSGTFWEDSKHGRGTVRYADGRVFQGRFVMGAMVEGTMRYATTATTPEQGVQAIASYTGRFLSGKRHGRGEYHFQDGSLFVGDFVEDTIDGHGRLTWPDGGEYVGEWSKGIRHGLGREYRPNGEIRHEGLWRNGQPVR
jgi:hypothetical protein